MADKDDDVAEAARKVLTLYWRMQADGWDQRRWESCIGDGLVDDWEQMLGPTMYGPRIMKPIMERTGCRAVRAGHEAAVPPDEEPGATTLAL